MRPTRDEMLMEMAEVVAKRSTCSRASVGVVIARDGRPLVTGYNGAPTGMPHCNHGCTCPGTVTKGDQRFHDSDCPALAPCFVSVHAEANAIAYAARWGITLEHSELFTTMVPCLPCAQIVINCGISRVIYSQLYRKTEGLDLLADAGIALDYRG